MSSPSKKKQKTSEPEPSGTPTVTAVAAATQPHEGHGPFLSALTILVQNEWIGAPELGNLQQTCRDHVWCHDGAWKELCCRFWPNSATAPLPRGGGHREIFREKAEKAEAPDPQEWLNSALTKVQSLPKWNDLIHYGLECGRCGCNCSDGMCPLIPTEGEFRYDHLLPKPWPLNREFVDPGEGYQMSGGSMIAVNTFCEPCFERLVEKEILDGADYQKVRAGTLLDSVAQEILNETGPRWFFTTTESEGWQTHNGVEADDVAVVIAHALTQPESEYQQLDVSALHFNSPGFGKRGYKAIACALSINTSLQSIKFAESGYECVCGTDTNYEDETIDKSNGLFAKALQQNKDSSLQNLQLCQCSFGEQMMEELVEAKPDLNFGS